MRSVTILRLDHRTFRDQRITSHVALTARALGASHFVYSGEKDENMEQSITDVAIRWGGTFSVKYIETYKSFIKQFNGIVVHLTMYGENHEDTVEDIDQLDDDILLIVGGAKVPPYVYSLADFNTAIGWQPHSEVAAIAVFLQALLGNHALYTTYENATIELHGIGHKAQRSQRFSKEA